MPDFAGMEELKAAGLDEKAAKKFIASQIMGQAIFMNTVATRCFQDCVVSFRTRELAEHEGTCIDNCSSKYFQIATILDGKYWELQHQLQTDMQKQRESLHQ